MAGAQEYLFSHMGVKEGLNEENINGLQQDKKGFIWIATHNALQRYDGQRFLTFRSKRKQPGAIPEPGIRSLLSDSKNRLWLITGRTRVGYFDVDRFIYHEVPVRASKEILEKSDGAVYMDASGNIMLVLVGKGIYTFNEAANEFAEKYTTVQLPPNWKIIHLWQHAPSKIFWMGCDSGLVKYDPVKQQLSYRGHNPGNDPYIKQFEKVRTAVSTYMDNTKRLWVTYWPAHGMFIESYRPGEAVYDWRETLTKSVGAYFEMHGVTEMKDGSIWLAGPGLLGKLNEKTNRVEVLKKDDPGEFSIRYDRIGQLMEDREKNIWISTDKGVYRFNPSAQIFKTVFNRLPGANSNTKADVTDILQTSGGEILVSTWGAGVFTYDKNFNPIHSKIAPRNYPSEEGMVWCMAERKNKDVWRGSQDGYLYIYHAQTNRIEKLQPAEIEKSTIRQVAEDTKGNMWLGTQRGYLVKWDNKNGQFSIAHKFKSIIVKIYVDNKGDLWVCTSSAGLFRLNNDGQILYNYTATSDKNALLENGPSDIIQYNDSLYCIANDGLSILNIKKNEIKHLTVDEGLPSTKISNLVKDKEGFVWMTCASGVASFNPLNGKLSGYNSTDGIHTNAFSLASNEMLNDGRIVFGTSHDMLAFDPFAAGGTATEVPKVEITGITVGNKPLDTDSVSKLNELRLTYDQNSISIQLATLSFQNIFIIHYKMDGIDKEWKVADKSNTAVYSYLPPGEYLFQVACKKADGTVDKVNTIKIRITAPFWKTWWFFGGLALIGLLIVYLLDKQRIDRMKAEEDIRTSIAGNLHQEVNTTLQNIHVLSEIAGMKADKNPEQSKDYIHEIKQKSRNMVTALNDVLWSIDPANDSMEKNIDRMKELAASLKAKYNTDINVQVDDNVKKLRLDMKKRHEFISIYKLSITTLAEQMMAEQVIVQLDYVKNMLSLKIYSTAANILKGSNTVIRNINEMRERAAAVNAVLDIQSDEKNTGIVLTMKV